MLQVEEPAELLDTEPVAAKMGNCLADHPAVESKELSRETVKLMYLLV